MLNKKFDWIEFYTEFANKLLEYKDNRKLLLEKLVNAFKNVNIRFPKLERDDSIVDIDPFTAIGFFNRGLSDKNRIKLIEGLKNEFDIVAKVPTGFDGIPVLNAQKSNFFYFDRNDDDIDNLWEIFDIAIQYEKSKDLSLEPKFIKYYNQAISQPGVKWNLSMGLFWIRPNFYINLDGKNRWYIMQENTVTEEIKAIASKHNFYGNVKMVDGKDYLKMTKLFRSMISEGKYSSLYDFSDKAFICADEDNAREKENNKIESPEVKHYWIYAAGNHSDHFEDFYKDGIMAIDYSSIGNLIQYKSRDEIETDLMDAAGDNKRKFNDSKALWDFYKVLKLGDVVFVKQGNSKIIGRGIVDSDYIFDGSRSEFKHIRKVKWLNKGEWTHPSGKAPLKTLTDITNYRDYVIKLENLFVDEENNIVEEEISTRTLENYEEYDANSFLKDVYMSEDSYDILVNILQNKKNIILQGAPGVGKSYAAKRLAYSIMGEINPNRVDMVQFHQSYSYEDFIMGYRPSENGTFEIKYGAFYNFCKKAEEDSENNYYFIIDEINRGNLSKIFGELFLLLEANKRGEVRVNLLYNDEAFTIPKNVYIIGTMNTADRSLAIIDYALRRRFAFFELKPAFESDQFITYKNDIDNPKLNKLVDTIIRLNDRISRDESLGKGFCIGHSYLCNLKKNELTDKVLSNIVDYELIPLIEEYWFDEPSNIEEWSNELRRAIK